MLRLADREGRAHRVDVGRRDQFARQPVLVGVPILGDDLQDEVGLARHHRALAHHRPAAHAFLERREIGLGLAMQADVREHRHAEAEVIGVELGVVALDVAGLFQRANAAQARRRRDADRLGQPHVRHAAVVLQGRQDAAVDFVELYARHASPPQPRHPTTWAHPAIRGKETPLERLFQGIEFLLPGQGAAAAA